MKKDARCLSKQVQEEKRRMSIKLWKKSLSTPEIAELLEVSIRSVQLWISAYKSGGMSALKTRQQGAPKGTGKTLSPEQEAFIRRQIQDAYPDQLKLDYALWTRKAVMELIETEYGISMPIRTVVEYLKRWGMTPQKPQKRAYEQRAPALKSGLKKTIPRLKSVQKTKMLRFFGEMRRG